MQHGLPKYILALAAVAFGLKLGLAEHLTLRRHGRLCRPGLRMDRWAGRLGSGLRRLLAGSIAGRIQTLIQSAQGNGSASLGLSTRTTGGSAAAAAATPALQHIGRRKGRAETHGDEHVKDLVGDCGDDGFGGSGKELGKGKGLGGVAAERGRLGGVEVGEDRLVEAQVGPAGEEAIHCLPNGCAGEQRGEAKDGDETNIEDRGAHNAQGDDAAE